MPKVWRNMGRCWSDHNADAQKAYYGGRVQVFTELGVEIGPVRSMDANSMFPSVMLGGQYPDIDDVHRANGNERILMNLIDDPDRLIWAQLEMTSKAGINFLPMTNDEGRRVWDRPTFSGWLAEPEIKYAIQNGWQVDRVGKIHHAAPISPFDMFITKFYNLRNQYKRDNDGRELMVKLLLNSLYGKFGQRPMTQRIDQDAKITKIMEDDDYEEKYQLRFYDGTCDLPYLMPLNEGRTPRSQWFGFAAFITSYARVELQKVIQLAGEHAVYCDTDSVHYHEAVHDRMMSMVPLGDELGQWKLETPDAIPRCRYWEPKVYLHMDDHGNKLLVKHKGVDTRDSFGNYLSTAGDLTKAQPSTGTYGYAHSFRLGVEPGRNRSTMKRSRRHYIDE